jgi:hypothetical protein
VKPRPKRREGVITIVGGLLILGNLSKEYVNQRTRRRVPLVEIIKQEAWYLASIIRDGLVKDYKCFTWVF